MKACVYCKTRYLKGSGVTFHKFPTNETLGYWLQNMNVVNWTPRPNDLLCSKHFTEDEKFSIPTIFNAPAQANMSNTNEDQHNEIKMETPDPIWVSVPSVILHNDGQVTYIKEEEEELPLCHISDITSIAQSDPSSCVTSQCGTPRRPQTNAEICANVKLDHSYENSPQTSEKLQRVQKALKISQLRAKVLRQYVKRLKIKVAKLTNIIVNLKKEGLNYDKARGALLPVQPPARPKQRRVMTSVCTGPKTTNTLVEVLKMHAIPTYT